MLRRLLAAVAAAAVAGPAAADGSASLAPCGTATLATVAAVDRVVANNIYRGELTGSEVAADARHVETSAPLLAALAAHDGAATRRAVAKLVYHRHWHIVRLRVIDRSGHVLADVGGPYVIAPVTGILRVGARVLASYVMSVQDDVGFTKLELHAEGNPIAIYYHGARVAEAGGRLPAQPPDRPSLTLHGVSYAVVSATYRAFPTGTLTAVVLVPPPAPALTAQPCIAVRAAEIGRVAQHLSARFQPLESSYPDFATTVHADTGATVILRIGPRPIAGSQGIGPAVIPDAGAVAYQGRTWWVFSWTPTPPARVYLLVEAPGVPPPTA